MWDKLEIIDLIAWHTVSAFKKHLDNYIFNQELIEVNLAFFPLIIVCSMVVCHDKSSKIKFEQF